MSEKVLLPKEVCDALDYAKRNYPSNMIMQFTDNRTWGLTETIRLNDLTFDTVMQALVLGYEPELSAEEQIKNLYFKSKLSSDILEKRYSSGISDALRIHGIRYDWMDAK